MYILVVDDKPASVHPLVKILTHYGYAVEIAIGAQQALSSIQGQLPDLVLLDVMMPDMDGYEFCTRLKANPSTQNIPVVFVSALSEVPDKVKALDVGGVDYVTKPFKAEEVLARVKTHLTISHLQKELQHTNNQLRQEILERQRVEAELKQYQEHLEGFNRSIIESSVDCIKLLDLEGRLQFINEGGKKLLCIEDVSDYIGMPYADFWRGSDMEAALAALQKARQGEIGTFEGRATVCGGVVKWWSVVTSPIVGSEGQVESIVVVSRDVTSRMEMEAQLRQYTEDLEKLVDEKVHELELTRAKMIQAAKLASLGEMATGIAHELNQPLTAMQFDADYIKILAQKAMVENGGPVALEAKDLYEIGVTLTEDIARARRITDYLREFSSIAAGDAVAVDVNIPIRDSFILSEARLSQYNISVERHLTEDLPLIRANPHRLEQVFLNLLSNAEYALQEMDRRIAAGEVQRAAYQKVLKVVTSVRGHEVVVEIVDNGCGIPESDQPRVFEPFFTSKPDGKASGLGLFIAHGIVAESGGRIAFQSLENEGTRFTLWFPIWEG